MPPSSPSLASSPSSPVLEREKRGSAPGKAAELTASMDDRHVVDTASLGSGKGEDILAQQDLDPALNMKMHLVNNVSFVVYSSSQNCAGCRTDESGEW